MSTSSEPVAKPVEASPLAPAVATPSAVAVSAELLAAKPVQPSLAVAETPIRKVAPAPAIAPVLSQATATPAAKVLPASDPAASPIVGVPRPYVGSNWTPQAFQDLVVPKIIGARKASATLAMTALLLITPTIYPVLTRGFADAAACPTWVFLLWLVGLLDLAYALLLAQVDHKWSRLASAGFMALQAGCAAAILGVLLLARGDHPLLGGLQISAQAMRGAAIAVCMVSVGLHGLVGCLCGYLEEPKGGLAAR